MGRILVLIAAGLVFATAAPAAEQPVCKTFVIAKQKKWAYQGSGIKCSFMHDSVKAFLRDGEQPKNWKCTRVKTRGVCEQRKGADAVFVFYVKRKGLQG